MEQIRKLRGRIDVIFGKEDQDEGMTVFEKKTVNDGGNVSVIKSELDNNIKKAIISLNESEFTNPIFQLNDIELLRKPRLIGDKRLYRKVISEDKAMLSFEFNIARSVTKWTITGIRYDYDKQTGIDNIVEKVGNYIIEIPSQFKIKLYQFKETVQPSKELSFTMLESDQSVAEDNGQVTNYVVSKGIYFKRDDVIMLQTFTSHELSLDLGLQNNELFEKIEIEISKVHRIIVSDNGGEKQFNYSNYYADANKLQLGNHKVCWLSKCYDNQTEIYDGDEIQNIEITRQLPDSEGDVSYGLVCNSMKATILNTGRKLDTGYLKDVEIMGKRVVPYISVDGKEHKLGTYFVSEWDIPMDNSWVEFQANDRLTDFQTLMYTGFFPMGNVGAFQPETLYRIVESVFESINENLVIRLSNKIYSDAEALEKLATLKAQNGWADDETLYIKMRDHIAGGGKLIEGVDWELLNITIPDPYLERQPVWDVLDNIAKSFLCVIYIDEKDRLIIHTDMEDEKRYMLDGVMRKHITLVDSSLSDFEVDEKTVTASNAFSLSKPKKRKGIVTEVSTSYTTYDFKADSSGQNASDIITYYLKDLEPYKVENNNAYYKIYLPKYTFSIMFFKSNDSIYVLNENMYNTSQNRYYFEIYIDKSIELNLHSCKINGVTISSNSAQISVSNLQTEDKNALDYSAGTLLNCVENANSVANRLIQLYGKGREIFESEWTGNLDYDVDVPVKYSFTVPINAVGGMLHSGSPRIVSNSITFDGGLKQTLKALSYCQSE